MSKSFIDPPTAPVDEPRRGSAQLERKPSRLRQAVPFALGSMLIVLGLFFGFIAYRMASTRTNFQDSFVSIFVPPPSAVFGKDRVYVVLLGLDYDYTVTDQPFSSHSRTDTIMVAGLDFPSKSLRLFSILRDTGVMINGRLAKVNEAYPDGGEPLSDRVIGDFLGMPTNEKGRHFDRYIIVNSMGLKDFVDAIGGIDVPVTEQMDYDDNWGHLHIHFKPGLVHMNGDQAMGYSRFRHDACSDPCRTKRQQQIIHITMAKLKAEKINDLVHIGQLITALNKNVKTNLTFDEEKSLAWAFKDANLADLSKADTIGYVDTRQSAEGEVLVPDDAQRQKVVAELLGPYIKFTPAPATALAAVKPSSVHVIVQNGSGISGLASSAAAVLKKDGYIVDSVGNADTFSYDTTQIRPASNVPYVGERVRKDLGINGATVAPATDATPGPRAVVTVILGKDFAQAQVTAATPSAPAKHASP